MLIVVEDRNLHGLAQSFFDIETIRGFDVLQIDPAKGGLEQLTELDDLVRIVRVHFDVEYIHIGEPLEEDGFSLHHRLAGKGSDIAQSKHCRPVAQHGHKIAAARVLERVLRILLNLQTGFRHARRIRQTQITLGSTRFGRCDFDFSRAGSQVIIQRLLLAYHDSLRNMNNAHAAVMARALSLYENLNSYR